MPWQKVNTVDLRREFIALVQGSSLSFSDLCRRYQISRKTGYKWLKRFQQQGSAGLHDQSTRPHRQPRRTAEAMEAIIVQCRERYPAWGARKLHRILSNQGYVGLPSPSTITEILRRHGCLDPHDSATSSPYIRFEHPHPNDLWQMDFKGHFPLAQGRCHPLTILDDHSRFSLCLRACRDESTPTVQAQLIATFRRYGLPQRMTMDNGAPWGSAGQSRFTQLTVWLIEQGITVGHSRPYHPQTQGKDERFHRTLKAELLGRQCFDTLTSCQQSLDRWRLRYNTERPHESLSMDTPSDHYKPSSRPYGESLPEYGYGATDHVRKVGKNLTISFERYQIFVGEAFVGKRVAIRPTQLDGKFTLHFCHQQVGEVDLSEMTKRKR